jgi:AbrB family looped-hinge helix DNA binding protein
MMTTITSKNMVTIPVEIRRAFGIKPGRRLEWVPNVEQNEIVVRVIPDRGELARRLLGSGRRYSSDRDSVAELVAERESDE